MLDEAYESFARIHGKIGISGFPEFDNLTGYVTGNYVSEWQAKDGARWRTVTTVINLGRPDRGTLADHEVQLVKEDWGVEIRTDFQKLLDANRQRKDDDARKLLVAYLMENGPQLFGALRGVTQWRNRNSILDHLRSHPDVYVKFSGNRQIKDRWGLVGIHDTATD